MQSFVEVKERLIKFNNEYKRLCEMLGFEEVFLDKKLYIKLEKEMQELKPIATKYEKYLDCLNNIKEYEELLKDLVNDEREMYLNELQNLQNLKSNLEEELIKMVFEFDAVTERIVVEVVNKSNDKLFNDIVSGYKNFSENNNFEVVEEKNKDNIKLKISGKSVKNYFNEENGYHVTNMGEDVIVFVYDGYNQDKEFSEDDIKIETCRSSGAGGQHVNTTDSAIKVTHIKTGITATCQDERSQLQNKQKAIENLKEKLENHFNSLESDFFNKQKSQLIKKIQNKYVVKFYNYDEDIILKNDKSKISLTEFLKGEKL